MPLAFALFFARILFGLDGSLGGRRQRCCGLHVEGFRDQPHHERCCEIVQGQSGQEWFKRVQGNQEPQAKDWHLFLSPN
jgi:hypothetical protein